MGFKQGGKIIIVKQKREEMILQARKRLASQLQNEVAL